MNNCSYVLLFILYSLSIKSQPFYKNIFIFFVSFSARPICRNYLLKSDYLLFFGVSYFLRQAGDSFTRLFPPKNGQTKRAQRIFRQRRIFLSALFSFFMAVFSAALLFCYFVVLPKPPSLWANAASSSVMPNGRKMPCIMPCPAAICSVLPSRESFVSLH